MQSLCRPAWPTLSRCIDYSRYRRAPRRDFTSTHEHWCPLTFR